MPEFARQLREALSALRAELPSAYARMAAHVGELEVCLRIGADEVHVRALAGSLALEVTASPGRPSVVVSCSPQTIIDLADGAYSVEDAIWTERLWLAGTVDDLVRFDDALRAFLHGAVRSPSFVDRLAHFKATHRDPARRGGDSS